jgi:hypothetical protein
MYTSMLTAPLNIEMLHENFVTFARRIVTRVIAFRSNLAPAQELALAKFGFGSCCQLATDYGNGICRDTMRFESDTTYSNMQVADHAHSNMQASHEETCKCWTGIIKTLTALDAQTCKRTEYMLLVRDLTSTRSQHPCC